jgi:hypothetical protein
LEERAREQAKSEGKDPEQAQPSKKAQHNFTDPESRMLKGPDGFVQGYTSTHPALPHEAARYANLKRILDRSLVTDPQKALTKVGRFEVAGEPSLPKSVLRPVQVRWTEPQS